MADSYTQQSSLDLSQTAYDLMVRYAYRPELYFDQVADVQSTDQSTPGPTVQFTIMNDLALATTALSETTDVSAVSLSDSTVSVSLTEYGNAVITTARLRGTSFVAIDPIVANVIGYNAGASIDTIARNALDLGTNVMYASGLGATALNSAITSRVGVTTTTTCSALDIRVARARLNAQNVPKFNGNYMGYIHPDIVADLQGEYVVSGAALGWRAAQTYADRTALLTGEFGQFEGIRFIETPRAPIYEGAGAASAYTVGTLNVTAGSTQGTYTGATPAPASVLTNGTGTVTGSGSTAVVVNSGGGIFTLNAPALTSGTVTSATNYTGNNVYGTFVLGRQSLAKAFSSIDGNGPDPHLVPGPVTDHLRRLVPMGWYHYVGYKVFRQAALIRIESASQLGNDVSLFNPAIDAGEYGSPLA
jgi:N4-gp56 family major capsid protein